MYLCRIDNTLLYIDVEDTYKDEVKEKGYFCLKFPEQKVYCGTIVLFILVNLVLGMASQPIIALIAEGLHHFA